MCIRHAFARLVGMLVCWVTLAGFANASRGQNVIINGDFRAGATGFQTSYVQSSDLTGETRYAVGTDPHLFHPASISFGDHTSGNGLMMMMNGATSAGVTTWQQTVPVAPGTSYSFSGWVVSWGNDGASRDPSPATLHVTVNGTQIRPDFTLPTPDGQFVNMTGAWDSGSSTSATINITDLNTNGYGNDYAG